MNWVIIATGLIFLICVVVGLYRGAVKIAVSLVATVVTFILVFFLTPYVSQGIMAVTPLDEMIESQAEQSIMGMASSVLQGDEGEGDHRGPAECGGHHGGGYREWKCHQ